MSWTLSFLIASIWIGAWFCLAAVIARSPRGCKAVPVLRAILPPFTVIICFAIFVLKPSTDAFVNRTVLLTHHVAIFSLFLFLLTAEYLRLEARWRRRARTIPRSVAASYRRLWIFSETVPAPIALTILLSGLRLIWLSPDVNSPAHLWLSMLIVGFSVFFWDGIVGYLPIVRRLAANGDQTPPRLAETLQLSLHCASWPFLFLLGLHHWKPQTAVIPFVGFATARLRVLGRGWPEVLMALLLWLFVGLLICVVRIISQHSLRQCKISE